MYVNRYSRVTDAAEVIDFLRAHPFGILVANHADTGIPIASHVPFCLKQEGDDFYLLCHLARGNELIEALRPDLPSLAIFQGPHAYISPSWYQQANVPTWNYQSVHVYGNSRRLSSGELEEHVAQMMDSYEHKMPKGRQYADFTDENKQRELKGIEGFSIKIDNIEASYKLSQNRTSDDYSNIIQKLRESENGMDRQLAEEMERIKHSGIS